MSDRNVITMEDIASRRFEYLESSFPLSLACTYRMIFMTELWRLSIVPRVSEKKRWINTSTVNNETIELQMQMIPVAALQEDTQNQMLDVYSKLSPDESHMFVSTWAQTLHTLALDTAVVVVARNDSSIHYSAVTTEHCKAVLSSDFSVVKEGLTRRAFCSQALPNVSSVTTNADLSAPSFIHLFLLNPKYNDLATMEKVSEVKILSRFLPVRCRENACFNVFSNVMFHTPTMIEDSVLGVSLTSNDTGLPESPMEFEQRKVYFTMEPCWPIYTWRFVWTAATRILLMRLYHLLSRCQTGKLVWKSSTTVMTPTGVPVFEAKLLAGELALDWESELLQKREEMFQTTEGLPVAFQKREISHGYQDIIYYNFLHQVLLDTEYGKTISRCTLFDKYDQEETIMRLEFIENHPPKTAEDASQCFIAGIEKAIEVVNAFYSLYKETW